MNNFSARLLAVLFPCKCMVCGLAVCRSELPVCADCLPGFQELLTAKCPECGGFPHMCGCGAGGKATGAKPVFLFFYKPGNAHRIIYGIKEQADKRHAAFLARLLAERIKAKHIKISCGAVTYVPRRKKAIRRTGYDQAKLIARSLAAELGMECIPTLERSGATEQKFLSASGRRAEAKKSYKALSDDITEKGKYKSFILVDDICTTGATLEACAKHLRAAGAGEIMLATIAKTGKGKSK